MGYSSTELLKPLLMSWCFSCSLACLKKGLGVFDFMLAFDRETGDAYSAIGINFLLLYFSRTGVIVFDPLLVGGFYREVPLM